MSAEEKNRRAMMEKERERMLARLQQEKDQIAQDHKVRASADRFVVSGHDIESELKLDTIGLVSSEQYRSIRERLESKRSRSGADLPVEPDLASSATGGGGTPPTLTPTTVTTTTTTTGPSNGDAGPTDAPPKKKKRKRAAGINTNTLSFGDDDPDLMTAAIDTGSGSSRTGVTKDPTVDTSFLRDRAREEDERRERDRLAREWHAAQEIVKRQEIVVEYSYWDGNGHRNKVTVAKGDTILVFLEKVRAQWPELRGVAADNLVFVKEDILLPHYITFYDLIINKVRGKSGPIFDFTIRDDVRLINDAQIETTDSHPGKVCQRVWY
ncbi:XAP5, circadian clock regulator-domain-containing protein, partial [Blastocladiella britannica]